MLADLDNRTGEILVALYRQRQPLLARLPTAVVVFVKDSHIDYLPAVEAADGHAHFLFFVFFKLGHNDVALWFAGCVHGFIRSQ